MGSIEKTGGRGFESLLPITSNSWKISFGIEWEGIFSFYKGFVCFILFEFESFIFFNLIN